MRAALDFTGDVLGVAGTRAPRTLRRYGEDPGPGFTVIPYTDSESAGLIDEAVHSLIILRGGSAHDPGAMLSVLVSLGVEVEARIPDLLTWCHHRWVVTGGS